MFFSLSREVRLCGFLFYMVYRCFIVWCCRWVDHVLCGMLIGHWAFYEVSLEFVV